MIAISDPKNCDHYEYEQHTGFISVIILIPITFLLNGKIYLN